MKPLKCNGCTLCCQGDAIRQLPNDDKTLKWVPHERDSNLKMLDHKPNGDCIYLIENGCLLHYTDNKPQQCREMDCRVISQCLTKNEAKSHGIYKVYKRGKELLSRRF